MKKTATLFAAAALGATGALLAAAPASAQSSFSFGVTVGSRGYSSPYYGDYYRRGDYYPYSRAANRACARDPWCSGSYYDRWRGPVYAPAPVYAPPAVVYERRDSYDPLPRWREIAPREPYYEPYEAGRDYRYEDSRDYVYDSAPSYAVQSETPVTLGGAVRYDLAQRGYAASDFSNYGAQAASDPRYVAPVPYDQAGGDGAARSYIEGASQDPDDLLLGGPR